MTGGHCADCRYWLNDDGEGWGYCDRATFINGDARGPKYPDALIIAFGDAWGDAEDGEPSLVSTNARFGCIEFALKDLS